MSTSYQEITWLSWTEIDFRLLNSDNIFFISSSTLLTSVISRANSFLVDHQAQTTTAAAVANAAAATTTASTFSYWLSWPTFVELLHVRLGPSNIAPKTSLGTAGTGSFTNQMQMPFLIRSQQCKSTER